MNKEEGLIYLTGSQNPVRDGDVVFVHGLRGHFRGTWHSDEGNLKPQELEQANDYFPFWLGAEYPNLCIWSYRYRAEPSYWSAKFKPSDPDLTGITMPLFDRGGNLLSALKDHELGKRPLIFITHSMGGLVVKKMLRNAYDARGNLDNQEIITHTKGVIFLATPHTGSHLAAILGWLGGIGRVTVTTQELERANPDLCELNEWYRFNSENLAIDARVYYEIECIGDFTTVVDRVSANPCLSVQVEVTGINANHVSIAKPTSRSAPVFLGVKRFIKKCLNVPLSVPLLNLQEVKETVERRIEDPQ